MSQEDFVEKLVLLLQDLLVQVQLELLVQAVLLHQALLALQLLALAVAQHQVHQDLLFRVYLMVQLEHL